MGHAAGVAATIGSEKDDAVQTVSIEKLQKALISDGMILDMTA